MAAPISEHDEFLLSRLLDNDLPAAEAEALRRRIATEAGLRAAYASMARLDGLLKDRQVDQPQVDWGRFHARVIGQVESASRPAPAVIRLSRWLAVGAPLAAAAVIALVITLHPFESRQRPTGSPTPSGKVAVVVPAKTQGGELVVRVQRPVAAPRASEGSIRIDFKRSDQLAEAIRKTDAAEDAERPSGWALAGSEAPRIVAPDESSLFF
jgi:hypothetical protein